MSASKDDGGRWERHSDILFGGLPYLLLFLSTALSLVHGLPPARRLLTTLGLAAVAAGWILGTYTLPTGRRSRQPYGTVRTAVYFAGLLALSAALMARDQVFMLFAATGFLQALVLLPTVWAVGSVAATSFVVNTVPDGFPRPTTGAVVGYLAAIAFQTVVIGWINLLSSRLNEQHQRRKRTVAELRSALTENAGLHAQLITQAREAGVLDERQRMAGEIHDTLAQGLAGIIRQLEAAEHAEGDREVWRRHLVAAKDLARDSLAEARRSVQALRPEQLESRTLPDALESLVEGWSREPEPKVAFATTGTPIPLHAELEATLYRVAQEALANIAKHARSSKVGITLSYMEDVVVLDVLDDGVGFDPVAAAAEAGTSGGHGLGLVAMRRRLGRVAGTLDIESARGEGTAISAAVPVIPQEAGA
ncbi:sensor histidine kinase [Streptomyces rugosispiralis]|uniref:Oxygen sensor histidine kinase NreB n=1 Tax=Streptomyces rugosispiralis TaxID=2967341 RepID=A0ABT1UW23_9ACTN|nr:sensor histidine kinase [Streptomyces rugosispiralis]MCQ8188551.1 sensor histidine kinase [Streptomyces rugosispiralis]